jgi:4-amino-4-deoxy-L-arabinose transferase-like glycosyltransferase
LAATLAWILIPTIGFDLLKDNTHTILALLLTCLTWYYFIAPTTPVGWVLTQPGLKNNDGQRIRHLVGSRPNLRWYTGLGLIMGLGLLSKFNYAIFLAIFLIAGLSIKETRSKLLSPYFLWSIFLALSLLSPYLLWLKANSQLGLSSMYKISPPERTVLQGMFSLFKGIGLFSIPVLFLSWAFFSKPMKNNTTPARLIPSLILRYHVVALVFLAFIVLCGSFTYFETRWLIPVLFLSPLLFFTKVSESTEISPIYRNFVIFCLIIGTFMLIGLSYRTNFGQHFREKRSMIEDLKQFSNTSPWNTAITDSLLISGNLRAQNPSKLVYLTLSHGKQLLTTEKNNYLLLWQANKKPVWIDETLRQHQLKAVRWLKTPKFGAVFCENEK